MQEIKAPHHIAIIMDGNGRWAKKQNKPRYEGHAAGADALRHVLKAAADCGVKMLTVYAFSTENWSRPDDEVCALMELLGHYLVAEREQLKKDGVRFETIGDESRLSPNIQQSLAGLKEATAQNKRITLVVALNYSGRQELVRMVRRLAEKALQGEINPAEIDEAVIENELYTSRYPEPDLLIRTGGEQRISNFLLWQISYSELYFTEVFWPDFGPDDLLKAIEEYNCRERRFGKTSEQIAQEQ
ncbi:isoprenyl transferase [Porphyromonas macacae]|uniref:Isoprenyl transferase n=1 Tax=Porphyromonas macacae TaxID=28115 RepID=A0A379DK29_9PORP|nr:isoprenyl transferase [Porphyromonas macacae]SUB78691.1 Undecaprenyl pyrophosphate synthase [Porphyromonas macacae]